MTDSEFIRIVFGLKVRQYRQKLGLSQQQLAGGTGLSKSYINEIESGKKYPKHEKIVQIADALAVSYDQLVSTKLDKSLEPLAEILRSDFFKQIPLELFGINKINLISIVSEAPKDVTAFINTIIEISQNYNLSREDFYFAVMRSYQELHENYFPEIEEKASAFFAENQLPSKPSAEKLREILTEKFHYKITDQDFQKFGATGKLRSLYFPDNKLLMMNELLDENQKAFILAKEIGYNVLGISARPSTYSWLDFSSFDELLGNFFSSYFAGCLLISKSDVLPELSAFFEEKQWDARKFSSMMARFTDSPETFYYRLTNLLPQEFGFKDIFYLCFTKKKNSDNVKIIKEMHLNRKQSPRSSAVNEHYCRRWVAVKNLGSLQRRGQYSDIQISNYAESGRRYLVISTSEQNPFSDGTNRSYCIGILINPAVQKKIRFLKEVPEVSVGTTCEYCPIQNCEVRQVPAVRLEKEKFNEELKSAIEKIKETADLD